MEVIRSLVDDLNTERGIVRLRVALLLRSAEPQPALLDLSSPSFFSFLSSPSRYSGAEPKSTRRISDCSLSSSQKRLKYLTQIFRATWENFEDLGGISENSRLG